MPKGGRLGGGIDALLGSLDAFDDGDPFSTGAPPIKETDMAPIDRIKTNPDQPRKTFDEEKLQGLAESIKRNGVLQPILVEKQGEEYLLVAGERRYRAAKLAGLTEIPVVARKFSPETRLEIALLENIQREDLTAIEEARAYDELLKLLGLNRQELADRLGKSRSAVANTLRLLSLSPLLQREVDMGALSAGHARAILAIKDEDKREEFGARIVAEGLSVREAEKHAGIINQIPENISKVGSNVKKNTREAPTYWDEHERDASSRLNLKINIKGDKESGKVEIYYRSPEELARILNLTSRSSG